VDEGGGSSGNVFYIDKASIIKTEKRARSMQSYARAQKTPEGKLYRSVKMLHVYACEEHTTTLLASLLSGSDGQGRAGGELQVRKFNPEDIVPDSAFDSALAAACKIN
jgi:hypothetical protein